MSTNFDFIILRVIGASTLRAHAVDRPAGERLRNAHIIVNFDLVLAILSSKRVRQIKNRARDRGIAQCR